MNARGPRSSPAAQRPRRSTQRLDAVAPTAIAVLGARRQAQQTLREIDALLSLNESHQPSAFASADDSPGPGAYNPHKERTQWRSDTAVAIHRRTPAHNKKTAMARYGHARANKTPGPGAYYVHTADRLVKPRIHRAGFELTESTDPRAKQEEPAPVRADSEPGRADKWLSRFRTPKGAVAFKSSRSSGEAAQSQSRELRDRLRRIKLEKTRHTRLGFYSVRFDATETRLGSRGVVAMAKSAKRCQDDSVRHKQARSRRQLRAWRPDPESSKTNHSDTKEAKAPMGATQKPQRAFTATIQWQRARARDLFHQKAARLRAEQPVSVNTRELGIPTRSLRRDLAAHNMTRQLGRDTVRCRRKQQRVTTHFSSPPQKEPKRLGRESPGNPTKTSEWMASTAFDQMLGRDDATVDASGFYLVGRERDTDYANARLLYEPSDAVTRRRVRTTTIRPPHSPPAAKKQHEFVLSPKYTLVEQRTKGFQFVNFENQLDRRERAKPKAFTIDADLVDVREPSDAAPRAAETLKFRRKDCGAVKFEKMRGREDYASVQLHVGSELRGDVGGELLKLRCPRPVCLVDMDKDAPHV